MALGAFNLASDTFWVVEQPISEKEKTRGRIQVSFFMGLSFLV